MTPGPLRITVVGCGRLGSLLADRLSRAGHEIVVVDADATSFDRLPASFGGFRVSGDATELAVLRQARVEGADIVLATTRDDNVNLFVTQAATKLLGARHAIARVFEPSRESTYRALGVETVCPTILAAAELIDRASVMSSAAPKGEI